MNNVNVSGPIQPTATYKTKVLKGNHSFASQVTEPNMKYVIKHNFVLDGDVTIPENCILEFDGGSISGEHTITGTNTSLKGNIKCFTHIDGTFANEELKVNWFLEDLTASIHNVCNEIISCLCNKVTSDNVFVNNIISIDGGKYYLTGEIRIRPFIQFVTNGNVVIYCSNSDKYFVVCPTVEDCEIMTSFDNTYDLNTKTFYNRDIIDASKGLTLLPLDITQRQGTALWVGIDDDSLIGKRPIITNFRITGITIVGFAYGILLKAYHHYLTGYDHIKVERCNYCIVADDEHGGALNWDERILITNSLLGGDVNNSGQGYAEHKGNCFLLNTDAVFHIDGTSLDYFDCLFTTPEDKGSRITAFITNCHIEGVAARETSGITAVQGLVNKHISKKSSIQITGSKFVFSSARQGIIIPNVDCEIKICNSLFGSSYINNSLYNEKWQFLSLQRKPLSAKLCQRSFVNPVTSTPDNYFWLCPPLSYYNNIIHGGMNDNVEEGSAANLPTLKEGYSVGGFTYKVNQDATAALLVVNNNNIFYNYNNSKAIQISLTENAPFTMTITSPSFKVTPLSKYGLNFAISLNAAGMTESSRIDLNVKVRIYDGSNNLIKTFGNGAGEEAFKTLFPTKLGHGQTIWAPYTVPFDVPNNADHAVMELSVACPNPSVGTTHNGWFRVHGMYVENQD